MLNEVYTVKDHLTEVCRYWVSVSVLETVHWRENMPEVAKRLSIIDHSAEKSFYLPDVPRIISLCNGCPTLMAALYILRSCGWPQDMGLLLCRLPNGWRCGRLCSGRASFLCL